MTGNRILDIGDTALDMSIDVGTVLESTVAFLVESAVFQYHMIHIAERLFAADVAAHQLDVLTVPCEVFSVQFRIIYGYILAFPEAVFGGNLGVVNFYIWQYWNTYFESLSSPST